MKKYMDDYNYHDWSKFMVREPKEKPTGPHFAGVLFDSHYEWSGYEGDTQHPVPNVVYFAFPDQATLKEWVLRAAKDKKQFFFFEVKKLGNAELKIDVDLGV
jgi:hypothetical protein